MYNPYDLVVSIFLSFLAHDPPFISCFSLLFIFVNFSFSFVVSHLLGALFLPELSSLPFHFSSKFSCFSFCFCSFMVDYSLVRLDCSLVSFFFAHLCGLLEVVGRKRPRIGLFIEKNCPYRFVLLFLFLLVYRSVGIAQSLIMTGEGEVRSSECQ